MTTELGKELLAIRDLEQRLLCAIGLSAEFRSFVAGPAMSEFFFRRAEPIAALPLPPAFWPLVARGTLSHLGIWVHPFGDEPHYFTGYYADAGGTNDYLGRCGLLFRVELVRLARSHPDPRYPATFARAAFPGLPEASIGDLDARILASGGPSPQELLAVPGLAALSCDDEFADPRDPGETRGCERHVDWPVAEGAAPATHAFAEAMQGGDLASAWAALNTSGWSYAESIAALERLTESAPAGSREILQVVREKMARDAFGPIEGY